MSALALAFSYLLSPSAKAPEFDIKKLDPIVKRCEETATDCLVVMVDGKVVLDKWFADKPMRIESMSATKSVVNLAVGLLVKEGKLKSVDEPVSKFYPDYKGGGKEKVTVRHLLDHTSGIEAKPDTGDIYSSSDFVQNALEKPLTEEPGTRFFYNNRAVNLLAGVIGKAASERMDKYLDRKLFKRLGITDWAWTFDKAGNPHGMSGFQVRPQDMAKIGQFVLEGGQGLLPDKWVEQSVKESPLSLKWGKPCGWLWWPILENMGEGYDDSVFEAWKKAGIRPELIDKVRPLKGKIFKERQDMYAAFRDCFKDDPEGMKEINDFFVKGKAIVCTSLATGPVHSYTASGYLGQYMVIVPSAKLVAVRMRKYRQETEEEMRKRTFFDFHQMVDQATR